MTVMVIAIAMVTGLGFWDYYVGQEISSALFFLVPIALVTWYVGTWHGVVVSVLSALSLYLTDILWGLTSSNPMAAAWNTLAPLGFFVAFAALLATLNGALQREEELSRIDPLTGLYNRRYFNELAVDELDRARRYLHPISLAYMDLDNFKSVNDNLGHDAGDRLLQVTAALLRSNLRSTDIVARLGGDEFAVMLPEGGPEGSIQVIDKLRCALLDEMRHKGLSVSVSVGLVTFMSPPTSVDELLKVADSLMYAVKCEGKNNVKTEVRGR